MTKKILLLVLLALVIRLVVVYFQYSGDIRNHLVWAESILSFGTWGFYARHFPGFNDANYPPVMILLFTFFRFLYQIVNDLILWQNFNAKFLPSSWVPLFATLNMQAAFMKLPAIIADLGIGILLYRMFAKKGHALLISALYLFNPAVIYVAAVWGQVESIPLFFLVLSYYFLPRRYYFSHLAFALALLSKQTALWVLPIFAIIWFKSSGLKPLLRGLTLQAIVFILLYLPFALPATAFSTYLSTLSGSSTLVSDQANNLWYFIVGGRRVEDSTLLLGLSFRLWSLLLLGASYGLVCLNLWKRATPQRAAKALFWLSLFAFFLQTRVHERHLAPALPFLLLTDWPNSKKIPVYLVLSTYHLINLYFSLRLPFL
jgi:Gpi18-like mannosyltransferase